MYTNSICETNKKSPGLVARRKSRIHKNRLRGNRQLGMGFRICLFFYDLVTFPMSDTRLSLDAYWMLYVFENIMLQ